MICNSFSFKYVCSLVLVAVLFTSCESDDIHPALSLEIDTTELSELNGIATLTATLNGAATQNIVIPLVFSGTATIDLDYNVQANNITINQGQTTGTLSITGIADGIVEGNETIDITLSPSANVILMSNNNLIVSILDADVDTDNDGVPDAIDACPNLAGDAANNGCPFLGFLINEVLYDPAAGIEGDANGDGTREAQEDEFIEFYNSTANSIDLSGYTISDADMLRHTFPTGTIVPSNGTLIVFGGGNPTGSFGGALVQTASEGRLNLNNAGDFVTVRDAQNNTILTFDITPLDDNPNESYTRNPDLSGDFELHSSIAEANNAIFSPGTKLDGSSF